MKRHADQLAREKEHDTTLRAVGVTRVFATLVDAYLRNPGDFVCLLSMKRDGGEQMNYAMKLEAVELSMMGLDQQSSERELRGDWSEREKKIRDKRSSAVEYLARTIAASMMDFIEKNDPQFGYSPKEWREGHKT